jgi:PAS domain-containing protein
MLQLTVVKGPGSVGSRFELQMGRALVLGRSDDCDIRLPSSGISKKHCRLTPLPGSRLEVEDMGSSNGTFVNGMLVKKHVLKPGDTLTLNPFVLQLMVGAPETVQSSRGHTNAVFTVPTENVQTIAAEKSAREKLSGFLESSVFPWADALSSRFDVRFLFVVSFLIWSLLVVGFTASPFADRANERVVAQAVETARLYARQVARVNQRAIIDQRYAEIVADVDARPGQTRGLLRSLVLDSVKAQVLAPSELIGGNLPHRYAQSAISREEESVQMGPNGIAYVSVPVKIGTAEGNKVAATVLVEFDTGLGLFTLATILDQALSSILYSLLASFLLLIFVYRWIEGSIEVVAARIDEAMKKSETSVSPPSRWPVLSQLCEQVSNALGRAGGGGSSLGSALGSSSWAAAAVQASGQAAASFDSHLTVTSWNRGMERVIGIRATLAVGQDISGASRDVAFESAVREMAAETSPQPWSSVTRSLDFSGVPHRLSMASGDGGFFLTITKAEE